MDLSGVIVLIISTLFATLYYISMLIVKKGNPNNDSDKLILLGTFITFITSLLFIIFLDSMI